ncbi:MAG: hypothetical protein JXQ65_11510 [Candidatus Marinimicrobia bacterium]|nr:hypothetical protein [Candidatus Neomarinimicrobiota bacterium]
MSKILVYFLLTFPFSMIGAGLIPYPLPLHGILWALSILLIFSLLSAWYLWETEIIIKTRIYIILSLAFFVCSYCVFIPGFLSNYISLKQRFLNITWTLWFVYIDMVFSKSTRPVTCDPAIK